MVNQFTSQRNWKQEIKETCAKLQLCAILPEKLTANSKIKTICLHNVESNCRIYSLINRQYCCKSSASKAHNLEQKQKAAIKRWSSPFAKNPPPTEESNRKRSLTLIQTIKDKKEEGWTNPGWGRKPTNEECCLPGILYLIRYLDSSGIHFKIGVTKKKLSERFSTEYLISVIRTWNLSLGECFELEQAALQYASQHSHRYASPTTTELIRPEGLTSILEFIDGAISTTK
jgi:bisphosphoglycerate-dependent phosphoglycerate mutase